MATYFYDGSLWTNVTFDVLSGIDAIDSNGYGAITGSDAGSTIDLTGIVSYLDGNNFDLGASDDIFVGSNQAEVVDGGARSDNIQGNGGDDRLDGGDGNDVISGGAGNDTIVSSAGIDTVSGGAGEDTFLVNVNLFEVLDLSTGQSIEFLDTNGFSGIQGTSMADFIDVTGITGYEDSNQFFLGAESDEFRGSALAEMVSGEEGADTISGNDGDDLLDGGQGDDLVDGGAGDDTIEASAGLDTVIGGSGMDVFRLTSLNSFNHLNLNASQEIEILDSSGYASIDGTTAGDFFDVSGLTFYEDSNEYRLAEGEDSIEGSDLAEQIYGEAGNDTLHGNGMEDLLNGGDGDDSIDGGEGDDTIEASAGRDILQGGTGYDTFRTTTLNVFNELYLNVERSIEALDSNGYANISGTTSSDVIDVTGIEEYVDSNQFDLGAGDDQFDGNFLAEVVRGEAGSDTLNGNGGEDLLDGGQGDDVINGGEGEDTIIASEGMDENDGGAGQDTYRLVSLSAFEHLDLSESRSLEYFDSNGHASVEGTENSNDFDLSGVQDYLDSNTFELGAGDDTFEGAELADVVDGGAGADTLNGNGNSDHLNGGEGDDLIDGGAGDDTIQASTGMDTVFGGTGRDVYQFFSDNAAHILDLSAAQSIEILDSNGFADISGTIGNDSIDVSGIDEYADSNAFDLLAGDDSLEGSDLADVVNGGAGADFLSGNAGADMLNGGEGDDFIDAGDGDDTIEASAGMDTMLGGSGTDTFRLNSTNELDGLDLSVAQSVEVLDTNGFATLNGTADDNRFDLSGVTSFADGNVISLNRGDDSFVGSDLAEIVRGDDGADTLLTGGGDDDINAGSGNDSVDGGAGNDTIRLGEGSDVLVLSAGMGADVIRDFDLAEDSLDLSGFSEVDLDAAVVSVDSENNRVITFGDGSSLTLEGVARNFAPTGQPTVTGVTSLGETLSVDASGLDDLDGFELSEVEIQWLRDGVAIEGATEEDYALTPADVGTSVSASIRYTDFFDTEETVTSNGTDLIESGNNAPTGSVSVSGLLEVGQALAAVGYESISDVDGLGEFSFQWQSNGVDIEGNTDIGMIARVEDIGNTITVVVSYTDQLGTAETVTSAASDPVVSGITLTGTSGNDRLEGRDGLDMISGLDGSDVLIGNGGDDTLIGGATEADLRDLIFGGFGDDVIDGGYGNDQLRGDGGNDVIAGGFGADTVIGGTGNDTLTGSAFSDLMFGGDGDDFVNGGFGSDRVNGGAGADRFYHLGIFDHGNDWIQDYNAAEGDVLVFGNPAATREQFQINVTTTPTAGEDDVQEAFIIYRPTGQIMWALVDGAGQDEINLRIAGQTYDLTETM